LHPSAKKIDDNISESFKVIPKGLRNLNIIGISVGAFAADSCSKYYHETFSDSDAGDDGILMPASVHLTLLDPFTSKGVFGYAWGARNFGKTLEGSKFPSLLKSELAADVFDVYLNSDDPVPSTNDPIDNAYNFDVTKSAAKASFTPPEGQSMHSWPGTITATVPKLLLTTYLLSKT